MERVVVVVAVVVDCCEHKVDSRMNELSVCAETNVKADTLVVDPFLCSPSITTHTVQDRKMPCRVYAQATHLFCPFRGT